MVERGGVGDRKKIRIKYFLKWSRGVARQRSWLAFSCFTFAKRILSVRGSPKTGSRHYSRNETADFAASEVVESAVAWRS